ncbi:InlB B-repeat-containing protein [Alishewanella sp. BS5-314]|uniref:InlB B-repeat-containing protein n=1 Tax=Alishewanella sp. BS5-314 TaxID=2755587 RepID=UPI0021BA500C|nr:InlB B-repeat-containing protein [Alishewanella sp. BS5-314]MCT8124579.1 InlB B-repeat-containing protein [Alishewanella sp. BS5-314]
MYFQVDSSTIRRWLVVLTMILLILGFQVKANTVRDAGSYNELLSAVSSSASGDIINITSDVVVSAAITVDKNITINGNNRLITVPVNGLDESGIIVTTGSAFRVFNISGGVSVTINNLEIRGGYLNTSGGAIQVDSGNTLVLNNSVVSRSRGSAGGGIQNAGTTVLNNSKLLRNAANFGGGFNNTGTLHIDSSLIAENRSQAANGGGGGGQNTGSLFVNNSTFSNNQSTEIGGGINNYLSGNAYILNSTFTGNVGYGSLTAGGAIGVNTGTVRLVNNIFAYNYVRNGGTSTNPTSFALDDVSKYFNQGTIISHFNIFHVAPVGHNTISNNLIYNGAADGSDNTLFSGGILARITDGQGLEIGSAQIFRPFLVDAGNGRSGTLQVGSYALDPANAGTRTGYSRLPSAVAGYFDGANWQSFIGANPENFEVTTDQLGNSRNASIVRGATDTVVSDVYMLRLNRSTSGTVTGGSLFGDVYSAGASVTLSAIPNSGLVFTGWQCVTGCTGTFSTANPHAFVMPANNLTLLPVFVLPSYTVSFVDWDGTVLKTETVTQNGAATAPANPSRIGYTFTGWDPASFSNITANTTVTAQYGINSYTLNFDTVGGSNVASANYNFGATVVAPAAPVREGFIFVGWTPTLPATMPANNLSVTAQWAVNQYTLSFDSAGGTNIAPASYNFGATVVTPADPVREGYTFMGWTPAVPSIMPASNLVLTALWEQKVFTVRVSLVGEGMVQPATQQIPYGQAASFTVTLADNTYLRLDSNCQASLSGNQIVTAVIIDDCDIAATVYPAADLELEQSGPVGSRDVVRFRVAGGAGEVLPTGLDRLRNGSLETFESGDIQQFLTQSEDGSYLFSAEQTGRYTFEFTDSVSGQRISVTFEVLPFIAFTASSQPVQRDNTVPVTIWLSDEPIEYPARVRLSTNNASAQQQLIEILSNDDRRKTINVAATSAEPGQLSLLEDGLEQAILGSPAKHRLNVQLDIPPLSLKATVTQNNQAGLVVQRNGGIVNLSAAEINAVAATFNWQGAGFSLVQVDNNASFDPVSLATGRYLVQLTAQAGDRRGELELAINVVDGCPVADCSNTGLSGIPELFNAYAGRPNRLPICPQTDAQNRVTECQGQTGAFVEVPNQYALSMGLFSEQESWQSGQFGVGLAQERLPDVGRRQLGYLVNMDVLGLQRPGEAVPIAIPLPRGQFIPEFAVWRKLINGSWQDFVVNEQNQLASSPRNILGNCPGVSADSWRPGLNVGDACIRLTIQDGGPNDDDGRANSVIRDPGVLTLLNSFTLTFNSNGGSLVASVTQTFGSALNILPPVREGHSFIGWSPALPATMPAENQTYTAQWQVNQYQVQFDVAGGQALSPLRVNFGSAIVAPVPVRQGYTFKGWSPALPTIMPAQDLQVTALWYQSSAEVTSKGGSIQLLWLFGLALIIFIRQRKILALMLCLVLPISAQANSWYLDAAIGSAKSDTNSLKLTEALMQNGTGLATTRNNSDTAYRLLLGYQLDERFAIEAGWVDLGKLVVDYQNLPEGTNSNALVLAQPQRGSGVEFATRFNLLQSYKLTPYLRAGVLVNREQYQATWPERLDRSRDLDFNLVLGLGVDYPLSENFTLGISWQQYNTEQAKTRLMLLSATYRF